MSAADVLLADRKYVSSVSRSLTISGGGGSTGDGEGRASGAEKDRTFRFFAPAGGGGGAGGTSARRSRRTSGPRATRRPRSWAWISCAQTCATRGARRPAKKGGQNNITVVNN